MAYITIRAPTPTCVHMKVTKFRQHRLKRFRGGLLGEEPDDSDLAEY